MDEVKYICPHCGKRMTAPKGKPVPVCCGAPMEAEPLPYCTKIPNAEMARAEEADEPCADGTQPKKR